MEKVLYDPSLDHRDRDMRAAAAIRISDALNIPGFRLKEVTINFQNFKFLPLRI